MTEHTPGPLYVTEPRYPNHAGSMYCILSRQRQVAKVYADQPAAKQLANLLAAAPTLLAALEPFAVVAEQLSADCQDAVTVYAFGVPITAGKLRRAAEAVRLAKKGRE